MINIGDTKGKQAVEVALQSERGVRAKATTARMAEVALDFGVPVSGAAERVLAPMTVRLGVGRIVVFVGPSGSGKSTALNLIQRRLRRAFNVNRSVIPTGRAIIDVVCPTEPLPKALELLSACGLGEPRLWLRSIDELSDGQRFRAKLAAAIGRQLPGRRGTTLICDEFGALLHDRLARSVACNLRKLTDRYGLTLVLATTDERVLPDLRPDVTIRLRGQGRHTIESTRSGGRATTLTRRLRIERGTRCDYAEFAAMHYRATDELGFVDRVFVARERATGELMGIVVYSHGPLELALRNRATDKRFSRNPNRLNREMRILRRLVVHPDVRGCGLGHWLVRKTLPQVGTRFVECLATMGQVNPVFEKAGMTRIGTCAIPPEKARILGKLKELDVDPFERSFVMQVCRRPRVRRLVAELVHRWYQATTAGGEKRVQRQSPEFLAHIFRGLAGARPVYYLWERPKGRKRKGVTL